MTEPTANDEKYFNLLTNGFGYLSQVRTLPSHKNDPYLAVKLAAIQGPQRRITYTYYDCRVTGAIAKELTTKYATAINTGETVFVHFTTSGLWASPFTYQAGEKKGQPGACLRTNLLNMKLVMINGETVYTAPPKEGASDAAPSDIAGETEGFEDGLPEALPSESTESTEELEELEEAETREVSVDPEEAQPAVSF